MKKLVFTFLIVFGCLLAENQSKAAVIVEQTTHDTESVEGLIFRQEVGYFSSTTIQSITSLKIRAKDHTGGTEITACIRKTGSGDCSSNLFKHATATQALSGSEVEYTFNFPELCSNNADGSSPTTCDYYGDSASTTIEIDRSGIQYFHIFGTTETGTTSCGYNNPPTFPCGAVDQMYYKLQDSSPNPCSYWTDFANCIWEGNPVYPTGNTGTGVCYWDAAYNNGAGRCIDNFNNTGLTFGVGDTTDFYPSAPTDCQFTLASTITTTTIAFPSQGIFQNAVYYTGPAEGEITYTDLNIYFYGSQGTTSIYHIPGYAGPNSAVGWATDSISLEKDNYRIEYKAEGYDAKGQYQTFTHYCSGTGIGYSTVGSSTLDWYGTGNQLCSFSDCSTTSWSGLDRLWCEAQNFGLKLICPSPASLAKARGAVAELKTKFPLNYIYLTSGMFSTLASTSSLATSTATSTMMAVNLNDFSGLAQLSFFTTLRMIFTTLLILIFGLWLIRWAGKIFQ